VSLPHVFFVKETWRKQLHRWQQSRYNRQRLARSAQAHRVQSSTPGTRLAAHLTRFASQFFIESLEPRLLLSATPVEVVAPQESTALEPAAVIIHAGSLPSLDVDLNGQADALSDGVIILRHLFGFTGTALTNGVIDPSGLRTDPAEIASYLNSMGEGMLDIDANGALSAVSDGIAIIRGLLGFTGVSLTEGVIDPSGQRTDPTAVETFLNNMIPSRETTPPQLLMQLEQDTVASNADGITFNPTVSGFVVDINAIQSFRAGFDAAPLSGYANVLGDLSNAGTFTLSRSRLAQVAGGVLADGSHTLHVEAGDARYWGCAVQL
jgi:hypothetical protein